VCVYVRVCVYVCMHVCVNYLIGKEKKRKHAAKLIEVDEEEISKPTPPLPAPTLTPVHNLRPHASTAKSTVAKPKPTTTCTKLLPCLTTLRQKVHTYTHTHTYTHKHTHTHAYTYIYNCTYAIYFYI